MNIDAFKTTLKGNICEEHAEIMLLGALSHILENYENRKAAVETIKSAIKAYDEVKKEGETSNV